MNLRPLTLRNLVNGPLPALLPPIDVVAERWARVPPRARMLIVTLLLLLVVLGVQHRVAEAEGRWGGAPVTVLRAAEDLPAGASASALERVALPPAALPPRAVRQAPEGAVLSVPLPAGSVLTEAHLDPHGPAVGLPRDLRAVPVPVEAGWRVEPGGWVDVWVLSAGEDPSRLVARDRTILQVREDEGVLTALVALRDDEVGPATEGLALGSVLLTHAPPPQGE